MHIQFVAVNVVTFDLDHTLVRRRSRNTPSLKMRAINRSIEKVFSLNNVNYFSLMGPELYGMTDRSIMRKVLERLGISPPEIDANLDKLFEEILAFFQSELVSSDNNDYESLPGVQELLVQLAQLNIVCGLATGNYSQFAKWKLENAGLDGFFTFGGYGEDGDERWQIVKTALSRSGLTNGAQACHFGDTPADIKAAGINGMLSIAITIDGGGKFPKEELTAAGASLVIDSYYETNKIFKLFTL